MRETSGEQQKPSTSISAFLKELYRIWITERPTQFAAALAYYAIFSFVLVIYVAFAITDVVAAVCLYRNSSMRKSPVYWVWKSPRLCRTRSWVFPKAPRVVLL
jgi:hypothetical protein